MRIGKVIGGLLATLLCIGFANPASAKTVNLASVPLFVTAGVDPNIVFVLDDSGSMRWGFMPDELVSNYASGRYVGDCDDVAVYGNNTFCVQNADSRSYLASSKLNHVYFDPAKTYDPPPKASGGKFPNAPFTGAPLNGYDSASATVDLSSGYRALMDDYYYYGYFPYRRNYYTGYAVSPYSKAGAAFYYQFTAGCSDPYNSNCYSLVRPIAASQKQNFANWFSYYRTRLMAAKAGASEAFSGQPGNMRVGYGTINSQGTIVRGVRPFVDVAGGRQSRTQFFDWLQGASAGGGTPLRAALKDVGDYYSRTDDKGPYSSTPGVSGGSNYECRKSYTVLTTDGYWSGSWPWNNSANYDGSAGPSITKYDGSTYQYSPVAPFSDNYNNTLADVAMYYWDHDLQPTLLNKVPATDRDPAFWQHMVTYGVGFGVGGTVNSDTAFAAAKNGASINWPDPSSSDPAKVDDLLHAGVNSRGGFFSASDPQVFSRELSSLLADIINRGSASSSSIAANSTSLDTNSLVYQALFNSNGWYGDLVAYSLQTNGDLLSTPNWKAGSQLDAYTNSQVVSTQSPRNIYTSRNDKVGLTSFYWADLSTTEQTILNGSDGKGQARLDYLRGDRSQEAQNGGVFRDRKSRLGDIVNSSPAFSGRGGYGYQQLPGSAGADYPAYLQVKRNRREMVYVGANDGMLHGFDANTGDEVFSFIPRSVFDRLPDLTSPNYNHEYFVDGSPIVTDVYLNGSWKTVLVGTLNEGGNSIYALDITDPNNPSLMWQFSDPALGVGIKEVSVIPTSDTGASVDHWLVAVGNGYNSSTDQAALVLIDMATGALYQSPIIVGGTGNGMAAVTAISSDGSNLADTIYAGDLKGNMWKFNHDNKGVWSAAYGTNSNPAPLFHAVDDAGHDQPITSRPDVGKNSDGKIMVYFGTGKYLEVPDISDNQVQSLYGIIDDGKTVARTELLQQKITDEGAVTVSGTNYPYRIVSNNQIGSQPGWYINLISPVQGPQGERLNIRPVVRGEAVVFVTLVPSSNPCDGGGSSWMIAVDKNNGGLVKGGVYDLNNDGVVNKKDYVNSGTIQVPVSAIGSYSIATRPNFLSGPGGVDIGHVSESSGKVLRFNVKGLGGAPGRQSWRQIR